MELIKDLPEVFEEFAEQRKNSFLALKKIKDQGTPVVGSYCTYFPRERSPWPWELSLSAYALHLMRQSRMQRKICQRIYVH